MPKTSTYHKFKRLNRSRTLMSRWVGSSELFWFWFFFPCISRLRNRSKVQFWTWLTHRRIALTSFFLISLRCRLLFSEISFSKASATLFAHSSSQSPTLSTELKTLGSQKICSSPKKPWNIFSPTFIQFLHEISESRIFIVDGDTGNLLKQSYHINWKEDKKFGAYVQLRQALHHF